MFWMLNRWGQSLPGLRLAEPAAYIMLGVIGLLVCAVITVLTRKPQTRLATAIGATAMWTWFCGLTIFHLWWKASFVGSWSSIRLELARQTIPAYWILGSLFIWTIYVAGRMWHRRLGSEVASPDRQGFPVIAPHEKQK